MGFITLWAYPKTAGQGRPPMEQGPERKITTLVRSESHKRRLKLGNWRESAKFFLQTPILLRNWVGYLMNLTKPELFSIEGPFDAASFSPDGKFLFFKSKAFDSAKAIGGKVQKVQIFNLAEEKRIEVLIKDKAPYGLCHWIIGLFI